MGRMLSSIYLGGLGEIPERTSDLLAYGSLIVREARQYEGRAWLVYDKNFRQQTVALKQKKWAEINTSLCTMAFSQAKAAGHCSHCMSLEHLTSECPSQTKADQSDNGEKPFPKPICRNWNNEACRASTCYYRHVCLECQGAHPALRCPVARRYQPYRRDPRDVRFQPKGQWPFRPNWRAGARCESQYANTLLSTITHTSIDSECVNVQCHDALPMYQQPHMYGQDLCTHFRLPNGMYEELDLFKNSYHLMHDRYMYTSDLLQLDNCISPVPLSLPPFCTIVTTPLKYQVWKSSLKHHPDPTFANYILQGIKNGFRIGFQYSTFTTRSANRNMASAIQIPQPVVEYLQVELQASRVIGPLPLNCLPEVQVSRFGVIPKRSQPNRWRLILDLSFPPLASISSGIDPEICSMSYSSVDDATHIISNLGPNCFLAKVDIAHAYRNVPVHPADRHLLGMAWDDQLFIDTTLPFGLRSTPKIFTAISNSLQWIFRENGVQNSIHYLDDFLVVSETSGACKHHLHSVLRCCRSLGVPVQAEKVEGPSTRLCFLGIEFDTATMSMRLPEDKFTELRDMISRWTERAAVTKRELLSLIGHLAHACKVVPAGRTFLRRMIHLSTAREQLDDWVRLNKDFKSDLRWWDLFLPSWNGVSLLQTPVKAPPAIIMSTDASGSWGCGAVWPPHWFQVPWDPNWSENNIAVKELVPIVLAAAVWDRCWSHHRVLVLSDNMAVVEIFKSRSCRDSDLLHLLRCLHFIEARWDMVLWVQHIPGRVNIAVDALSRNSLQVFYQALPTADSMPTPVPHKLLRLTLWDKPDWTSCNWKQLLSDCCSMV